MLNIISILLFILNLGSCALSQIHIVDTDILYTFPNQWHGYYEKQSNSANIFDALQKEFKIDRDYMLSKDLTSIHDSDGFLIYKIENIWKNTDSILEFGIDGAYYDQYDSMGNYTFERLDSQKIKVTYRVGIIFSQSESAIYNWRPL